MSKQRQPRYSIEIKDDQGKTVISLRLRLFILNVLARTEAQKRRRPLRTWTVAESKAGNDGQPRP